MTIILDVSAAMQIILKKEKASAYLEWYDKADWVIAPDLYVSEITNVLWKYQRAKIFTSEESEEYVEDGIALIDDFFETKKLWKEVLGESVRTNHSAYDMFYAVLTRRNNGLLLSNDNQLLEICKKNVIKCFG